MRKHATVLLIEFITPVSKKIKKSIILTKLFCAKNLLMGKEFRSYITFSKSKISTENKGSTHVYFRAPFEAFRNFESF